MVTLAMSVQFPATPPITCHPPASSARPRGCETLLSLSRPITVRTKRPLSLPLKAIEKSRETSETASEASTEPGVESESTHLGSEIKAAMEEKKAVAAAAEEESLLAGVSAEIKEIEWPAFGKVIGTTWVVLGVIAGSSVVLLTLNFVLAELSDKVFAGRGVQDFFS